MSTSIRAGTTDNALQVNGNDVVKYNDTGIISGYSNFSIGRNLIVNGSCQVDQVNSGALLSPAVGYDYLADNFRMAFTQAGKFSAQKITTSLLSLGASNALRHTVLSQFTPAVGDQFYLYCAIEGLNFAHLQWGTANAAPVSLQFKARASVAGTYSGSIKNNTSLRSYPFTFTLAANTDTQVKIENIPGDTSGTWAIDNTACVFISFDLGSGTTYKGTANAWASANYLGVSGVTNLVSQVNGSTLDISDVQLEKGSFCTTFERKLYDQVLRECQRYYEIGSTYNIWNGNTTSTFTYYLSIPYKTSKRASASITTVDVGNSGFPAGNPTGTGNSNEIQFYKVSNATASSSYFQFSWIANARL